MRQLFRKLAAQIGAVTPPPIIGDLEPSSVIESTYFFANGTKHIQTAEPVTLDGYQAVLKPSKFGYSLSAIVDSGLVGQLEEDRMTLSRAESNLRTLSVLLSSQNLGKR